MNDLAALVQIHDIDLLLEQVHQPPARERLTALGFESVGDAALQRARARLLAALDRRWVMLYDRALRRYGRALVAVRERVCQGCFITLPISAHPAPGCSKLCESCGRLLYWPQPGD